MHVSCTITNLQAQNQLNLPFYFILPSNYKAKVQIKLIAIFPLLLSKILGHCKMSSYFSTCIPVYFSERQHQNIAELPQALPFIKNSGNFSWTANGKAVVLCPKQKIPKLNQTFERQSKIPNQSTQMENCVPFTFYYQFWVLHQQSNYRSSRLSVNQSELHKYVQYMLISQTKFPIWEVLLTSCTKRRPIGFPL